MKDNKSKEINQRGEKFKLHILYIEYYILNFAF